MNPKTDFFKSKIFHLMEYCKTLQAVSQFITVGRGGMNNSMIL